MSTRISLEELKVVANKVRAAGGGNPLDALIPSVPEESSMCLIARNLNFNCEVSGLSYDDMRISESDNLEEGLDWAMGVSTRELGRRISKALGWELLDTNDHEDYLGRQVLRKGTDRWKLVLPREVGQVAADFDRAGDLLSTIYCEIGEGASSEEAKDAILEVLSFKSKEERKNLLEMLPYIEAAEEESYSIASIIHPDGSISI